MDDRDLMTDDGPAHLDRHTQDSWGRSFAKEGGFRSHAKEAK